MATCAFIGHRKIEEKGELKQEIAEIVTALIEKEKVDTFLFGSKSEFNDLCYEVVTELKNKYPHIRRIEVRASNEYLPRIYLDITLKYYEETVFPESVGGAGYRSYIKRNQAMIDMCDILVTYFDKDFQLPAGKTSGTRKAVEYALKKNKRIINLF